MYREIDSSRFIHWITYSRFYKERVGRATPCRLKNKHVFLSAIILIVLFLHTSLSPALPIIASDFNISASLSSWVMTAYMVSGAVMTIVIGRLADIYGAKKMLMMMMICYTVRTILAGFAQDISTLITINVKYYKGLYKNDYISIYI
jgi:MFS family permease